jgi:hypothetical protein
MLNISNFFEKFKKLHQNNANIRSSVVSVVKEVINIEIKTSQIEFRQEKIYIKAAPIIKSELLMNKDKIEEKLSLLGVSQKLG